MHESYSLCIGDNVKQLYDFINNLDWLSKTDLFCGVIVVVAPNRTTRDLILEDVLVSDYKETFRWQYLTDTKMVFYPLNNA